MTRLRPLDRNPTTLPLLILASVLFGTFFGAALSWAASLIIN